MSIEELIDENDALRSEITELVRELGASKAKIEELQSLVRRMAAELDARAANHVDPAQETREWFGTVEWRGPGAVYEANAAEINRSLAQQIHQMAVEANTPRNDPNVIEINPKEALDALPQATPSPTSTRQVHIPKGSRNYRP